RSPGTDLPPADRAARDKPDAIIERIIEPVISEHERTCIRRIRKMRSRDRAEPRDAVIVDLRCCQPVYLHRLRNLRLPRGLPLLRRTSDRFPRTGLGRARGDACKIGWQQIRAYRLPTGTVRQGCGAVPLSVSQDEILPGRRIDKDIVPGIQDIPKPGPWDGTGLRRAIRLDQDRGNRADDDLINGRAVHGVYIDLVLSGCLPEV